MKKRALASLVSAVALSAAFFAGTTLTGDDSAASKIAAAKAKLLETTISGKQYAQRGQPPTGKWGEAWALLNDAAALPPVTTTVVTTAPTTAPTTTPTTTSTPTTTTTPTTTAPTIDVPGTMLVQYGGAQSPQTQLGKWGLIDMSQYRVGDLKAAKDQSGGKTVVIEYEEPTIADDGCFTSTVPAIPTPDWCGSIFSEQEALAHDAANPSDRWLLRDAAGNPVRESFGGLVMNVGSASYQQAALPKLRHAMTVGTSPSWLIPSGYRYDGIFWDNAGPSMAYRLPVATYLNGVQVTDAVWRGLMLSWHKNVSAVLRSEGDYIMCNCGAIDNEGNVSSAWAADVGPYLSGFMVEYWVDSDGGINMWNWIVNPHWRGWFDKRLRTADAVHAAGMDFFPAGIGDCTVAGANAKTYSRAAFLLKWDGSREEAWGCFGSGDPLPRVQPWIGTPTEPAKLVGDPLDNHSHAYVRHYTGGVVAVNPDETTQAPRTVDLGGFYKKADGTSVSTVTLAPTTAQILTK